MTDERSDEQDVRARGPGITLAGGMTLFICLFLPAVDNCGAPVRPIEVPFLAWPHFMGMMTAVGAALALWRDRRGPEIVGLVLYLLALVASMGTGILFMASTEDYTGLFALPLLVAIILVLVVRKRPWRMGRAVWICGLMSLPWLGLFTLEGNARYGLWMAMGGAFFLFVGGVLWDWDTPPDPRPEPEIEDVPLPEARALRTDGETPRD